MIRCFLLRIYDIPFYIKRIICHIHGCKVSGGFGGYNLPPEAYCYYCERCGAAESNYQGDTYHKIIYKEKKK